MSMKSMLSRVPSTAPPSKWSNITSIASWDDMEDAIIKATNLLVTAQAEEHKAKLELESAVIRVMNAQQLLAQARAAWIERSRAVLGITYPIEKDDPVEQPKTLRDRMQGDAE